MAGHLDPVGGTQMRQTLRRKVGLIAAMLVVAAAAVAITSAVPAGAGGAIGYVITVDGTEPPLSCRLQRIDLATGELTPLGDGAASIQRCAWDLAFTPDAGTLYGLRWDSVEPSTVSLITFDLTTGEVTDVGQIGTFNAELRNVSQILNGGGLTFDNDGTLYASLVADTPDCATTDPAPFCTYIVDPSDPSQVTFLGPTTTPTGAIETPTPNSFAVACDGAFTGGQQLDEASGPQALTTIDRATGLGTVVAGFNSQVAGMDYDFEGTLWALNNPDLGQLYTVDRATAELTPTATVEAFVGALAIPHQCATPPPPPPPAPPEPIAAPITFTG